MSIDASSNLLAFALALLPHSPLNLKTSGEGLFSDVIARHVPQQGKGLGRSVLRSAAGVDTEFMEQEQLEHRMDDALGRQVRWGDEDSKGPEACREQREDGVVPPAAVGSRKTPLR